MGVRHTTSRAGFTIVEILIVIVVIGILASMGIVGYRGAQRSAVEVTTRKDLVDAAKSMTSAKIDAGVYPDVLPADVKTSPGVSLSLIKRTGGYSGLTNTQNGILFQNVCQSVISEGYGTGTNMGGGVEQYITGCNVYGYAAMQINGWDSHNFNAPIGSTTIYNWYNANITSNAWRPNKKSVYLAFATELTSRFTALGGTFPVASFWDPWATPTNGGVQYQILPPPEAPSDPATFCIQGTYTSYSDILLHIVNDGSPQTGACP